MPGDAAALVTTWTATWLEARILDYFWLVVADGADRLLALRQLARVVVPRPPDWSHTAVRATALPTTKPDACFSCLVCDRVLCWHHILLVKHGGSGVARNLVTICRPCHADVHAWLKGSPGSDRHILSGWTSMPDLIAQFARKGAAS